MTIDIKEIEKLPIEQRLELVNQIWDSIPESAEPTPMSDGTIQELRHRKETHLNGTSKGHTWEDVKKRVRQSND